MDVESQHTIKFLEALANTKLQFTELAHRLRPQSDIVRVLHSLECMRYQTKVSVEGYVDVELRNGRAVVWWLEINWNDDQWVIETSVLLNDNQRQSDQEVIKEFPDRTAETLDECIEQLSQAISDLTNSVASTLNSVDQSG